MKSLLQRWFGQKLVLTEQQRARLAAWQPVTASTEVFEHARLVVLDVETTGLDLANDTLISIGAVAVVNGRIALGDSFYVVLQQQQSSRRENILIHGISGSVQRQGVAPAEALLAFLDYLGNAPLVAFHVTFDETMIRRALRQYLGLSFKHPWLDLAFVLPALNPHLLRSHRALDDWARRFSIQNDERHNAVADALVTAQLLLIAVAEAKKLHDIRSYDGLRTLERRVRSQFESG